MAKFCTKCGTELKDGKCPKCDKVEKKVEKKETVSTETPIDVKECGNDCLSAIKGIFTKPFDAIKEFVSDNKIASGVIMLLLAAASAGLYHISLIKNAIESKTGDAFNTSEIMSFYNKSMSNKPDYLEEFLKEAGTKLAIYALIAVAGYIIIAKVLKGSISLKQVITAVGISLSVVIVAYLANAGLLFINEEFVGYVRTYITSFGYIFSILVLYYGIKDVAGIDKNKLFIAVASMMIAGNACWDIIEKITE